MILALIYNLKIWNEKETYLELILRLGSTGARDSWISSNERALNNLNPRGVYKKFPILKICVLDYGRICRRIDRESVLAGNGWRG